MRVKHVWMLIALLGSGLLTAVATAQSESVDATTRTKIEQTYQQLKAHFEANDIAAAGALLSEECLAQLTLEWVLFAHQVKLESPDTVVGKGLAAAAAKHELSQVIPESFFEQEVGQAKFERLEKRILKACGDREKQSSIIASIRSVFAKLPEDSEYRDWMPEPCTGKLTGIDRRDESVVALVDSDAGELELVFVSTESGWRLDDFMLDIVPKPLALIPSIELSGETVEGDELSLASLKGKVVLVDFWGTWCPPCVAELAPLKKIHSALNEKGFEVVGVAADSRETLRPFIKSRGLNWKNIVDDDGSIAESFNVEAYPTTLLINRDGEHVLSDIFGVELLDAVLEELDLDAAEYAELRAELGHDFDDEAMEDDSEEGIGFEFADADGDGELSRKELRKYLRTRLEAKLPYRKIFKRLDKDESDTISASEFETRHDVLDELMGPDFLSGDAGIPADPGPGYVLFTNANKPIDDRKVFGAVFHRYMDVVGQAEPLEIDLDDVPEQVEQALTVLKKKRPAVDDLAKATAVFVGGGDQFFTAGAVLISEDGLAVTNFHVAEALSESPCYCVTHDGTTHRVVEFLAGNRDRDVALVRLEGKSFHYVNIAKETPSAGDDLEMMHHSENRFFTYDRGYVMRHPVIGTDPWMEVSMDYAPGGSGCGIYNNDRELVGLVSIIQFGDGPSIAEPLSEWDESEEASWDEYDEEAVIMVKQAVSLSAIRSLWNQTP
ncbi:MAG: redoxin domain-containing protein [Planctomycetota bacterium]